MSVLCGRCSEHHCCCREYFPHIAAPAIFDERDKRIAELEARIAELMADAMALIECWGNLAIRNEASMAVWKDKLSPDMLAGMAQDRVEGFAAVKRLRGPSAKPEAIKP